MKAKIANYKGGPHTQYADRMILMPEGVTNKEQAEKLLDKTAVWTTPSGNKINGKVTKVHGRNGSVLVKFEKGLPGQSLGTVAEII
jgi:large subunit ribosomal protein L35Ae